MRFKKKNPYSTYTKHTFILNKLKISEITKQINKLISKKNHDINFDTQKQKYIKRNISDIIKNTNKIISFKEINTNIPYQLFYSVKEKKIQFFADHVMADGRRMYNIISYIIGLEKFKTKNKPRYIPYYIEIQLYIYFIYLCSKRLFSLNLLRYKIKTLQTLITHNISLDDIKKLKKTHNSSFISTLLAVYCKHIFSSLLIKKDTLSICLPYAFSYKKRTNNISIMFINVKKNNIKNLIKDIDSQINIKKYMLQPFYYFCNNKYHNINNELLPLDVFFSSSYIIQKNEIVKDYTFRHYSISSPININPITLNNLIKGTTILNTPFINKLKYNKKITI